MLDIIVTFGLLASAITTNKVLLYYMTPSLLVAIRMFIAGLILIIYNLWACKFKLNSNLFPNIFNLLIVTFCTTLFPSILKAYSLKNMLSSKAAFFGLLDPFITAILAYFILQERLTLQKILGILIGFTGAFILIVSSFKGFNLSNILINSSYELAAIVAVIISRFGWIIAQLLLKQKIFTPVELNSYTMLLSGIFSFIITFFFNQFFIAEYNNTIGFCLLYTIVIGNLLAYNLYANLLKKHSALLISFGSFLVPIFVQLFGYIFLSEPISMIFFISCFITFTGFLIFTYKRQDI